MRSYCGFFSHLDEYEISSLSNFDDCLEIYLRFHNHWIRPKEISASQFIEDEVTTFKYCPNCGEEIPWQDIKLKY